MFPIANHTDFSTKLTQSELSDVTKSYPKWKLKMPLLYKKLLVLDKCSQNKNNQASFFFILINKS